MQMRTPGTKHKKPPLIELVESSRPSFAIFGVIWKCQEVLRMFTNCLYNLIKTLTVENVEVNRTVTPLKTAVNKAIRVFE